MKEWLLRVGRFSLDTPIFSMLKVKQLARWWQGKFHFPSVIELSDHSIFIREQQKH